MKQEIWLGDCLELIKNIPEKSIDLVLTDPPYNIARKNNFHTMSRSGIDFGEWDKNADIFSYIQYCFKLLQKNGPPISTLMKSYSVLYGKEPLEI